MRLGSSAASRPPSWEQDFHSRVEVIMLQVWSLSRCLIPAPLAFLSLRSLKGRGRDGGVGGGGGLEGWWRVEAAKSFGGISGMPSILADPAEQV